MLMGGYGIDVEEDCSGAEIVACIGHGQLSSFWQKHCDNIAVASVVRNCSEVLRGFSITLRVAASLIEPLYAAFDGLMPLPLSVVTAIRAMDRSRVGEWLRVVRSLLWGVFFLTSSQSFLDNAAVGSVEVCLPGESDSFWSTVFHARPSVSGFRASTSGRSVAFREWRRLCTETMKL